MKLKESYITHDSDGEQILLDTSSSFAGLIRNNKTAAFIDRGVLKRRYHAGEYRGSHV